MSDRWRNWNDEGKAEEDQTGEPKWKKRENGGKLSLAEGNILFSPGNNGKYDSN